jgi:DNA-binding transcriptional ArsR family regulator
LPQSRTSPEGITQQVAKALAHPLRVRILSSLHKGISSPNQLAQELGEPLGNVSYHVKTLLEYDCVELVKTEPRRGAVEHFYRAAARAWFSDVDWARLPQTTRQGILGESLARIGQDVVAAASGDGFDHADAHASATPLELDAEGMTALSALLTETVERALEIQAASTSRQGAPEASELVLMHFARPA